MKPNQTSFKKGSTPWHKGKKGLTKAWNKGIRYPQIEGEKHFKWKGNRVGYAALHGWMKRRKGKATICEHCGLNDPKRMYHWANKSHKYLRDLDDWLSLCVPCHSKYDASVIGRNRFALRRPQ